MKLVRYGRAGAEKPGLVDEEGVLRDLSRVVKDITPAVLSPVELKKLRAVKLERLPVVRGRPLPGVGRSVWVGATCTDHGKQVNRPLPEEPVVFSKANSPTSGPHDAILRPRDAVKVDYEVELGALSGRDAKYVSEADASKPV